MIVLVRCLFLMVLRLGHQCMIVAFLGHTYFLFDKIARMQTVVNFIKLPNSVEIDQDLNRLSNPNISNKGGKDQETIQLSTTPDPGYHKGK